MEKKHLIIGANKDSFICELCKNPVGKESKDDYFTSDVDECEIWIHKKCLERAKLLSEIDWTDYS